MKRLICFFLIISLTLASMLPMTAYAVGDGNINNGGGGMGGGTDVNVWHTADEGVRVTVIRASDHAVVSASIDLTNRHPDDIVYNFGKVSKMSYRSGHALSPSTGKYMISYMS